jgi:hypothetical protein
MASMIIRDRSSRVRRRDRGAVARARRAVAPARRARVVVVVVVLARVASRRSRTLTTADMACVFVTSRATTRCPSFALSVEISGREKTARARDFLRIPRVNSPCRRRDDAYTTSH